MRKRPELHDVKPSGLLELRAKTASPKCISKYFKELIAITEKHELADKPKLIFNVDKKGIIEVDQSLQTSLQFKGWQHML